MPSGRQKGNYGSDVVGRRWSLGLTVVLGNGGQDGGKLWMGLSEGRKGQGRGQGGKGVRGRAKGEGGRAK